MATAMNVKGPKKRTPRAISAFAALGLLCFELAAPGCSAPFHSCYETRTCTHKTADAGSAGEAGSEDDSGVGGHAADAGAAGAAGAAGQDRDVGGAGGSGNIDESAGGISGSTSEASEIDKADGLGCVRAEECLSGSCTTFFKDADGDGYGSKLAAESAAFCGATPPVGFVANAGDCCDADKNAKPGQASFFPASNSCNSFDYNCNGAEELDPQQQRVAVETCNTQAKSCNVTTGWVKMQATTCGGDFYWRTGGCSYVASEAFCAYDRGLEILRCR